MIKFGINSTDLNSSATAIGSALGVVFRPHESDWRGGAYFRAEVANGIISLQNNRDVLDDEPFETGWPNVQLILLLDRLDPKARESYTEILRRLATPTAKELE